MIRNIINRIRFALLPEFKGEPTEYRTMEEVIDALNGGDDEKNTRGDDRAS